MFTKRVWKCVLEQPREIWVSHAATQLADYILTNNLATRGTPGIADLLLPRNC